MHLISLKCVSLGLIGKSALIQEVVYYLIEWYRKVSHIWRTLVGNKIVDHSDVVGASPVGAAPTTSSFPT